MACKLDQYHGQHSMFVLCTEDRGALPPRVKTGGGHSCLENKMLDLTRRSSTDAPPIFQITLNALTGPEILQCVTHTPAPDLHSPPHTARTGTRAETPERLYCSKCCDRHVRYLRLVFVSGRYYYLCLEDAKRVLNTVPIWGGESRVGEMSAKP